MGRRTIESELVAFPERGATHLRSALAWEDHAELTFEAFEKAVYGTVQKPNDSA